MKSLITSFAAGIALLAACLPATAQTNISVNIGQPGFYGRIELGDFGPPQVYGQPIIVQESRYRSEPVYLRVPPGHRKNWSKHCARYDACARPVMFVRDDWYANTYAPRYRAGRQQVDYRDDDRNDGYGKGKKDKHAKYDKHDRHDRHDKHGGKGNGKGRDH